MKNGYSKIMFSWNRKVKAGALQYVLIIAIIILIVLLSFIQFLQLQQKLAIKNNLYQEAILNTTNGFAYLSVNSVVNNSNTTVKFSENLKEETSIVKSKWGAFDLAKVTSKVNKETFSKIGLIGNYKSDKKALYLTDNNMPLVLVGNTKITGTSYLSKRGVKRGNIAGNSFYGTTLVNGLVRVSNASLPVNATIKNLSTFTNSILNKVLKTVELKEGDKLIQSFKSETLVYRDNRPIKLQDITLKGNIIIQSLTKIVVTKETDLEDIVLIAPEIEIQPGVKATFQAFASKKIHIDKNVSLNYPSFLVLSYRTNTIENQHGIYIEEGTVIKGGVYFLQKESKGRNLNPQIQLNANVTVVGEVFCQGNTELSGTVIGEVYTNNFLTKQYGGIYINHIYNGVINAKDLPDEFVGLTGNSKEKGVSKWLY